VTLADFLLARIAEDEEAARCARMSDRDGGVETGSAHISRWPPPRVLAECEAKRRMISLANSAIAEAEAEPGPPSGPLFEARASLAQTMLRAAALPYADHPEYLQEWAP
jgi:hypothetical protein